MASDAVVNLIVNASDAESELNVQLRQIVNDAERRAPDINLTVNISQRQIDDTFRQITAGLTDVRASTRDTDNDTGRLSDTFLRLGGAAVSAIASAGKIGLIGSLASTALPVVGALVTSLTNIAPAAAAGVTAFVAMKAATLTLQVGLLGVSDALNAVFDPDSDPAKVAEAIENLSDNAKAFVLQLQDMKPALDSLRLDIQDRLFQNLDKDLASLGKSTLPVLRKASLDFAGTFNAMARDVASTAGDLAESGTLGKALGSGADAFAKLEKVPGQVLEAIANLAVAGGPLLNRFTNRIAELATQITDRLDRAAESGGLEDAVNAAGEAINQLGRIAGNVFEIIGNVMNAASASGGSLFETLEKVTGALTDATAGETFQKTMGAIVETGQTLVDTVLPLLGLAFEALAPAIQTLAPFVQEVVKLLGEDLSRIIPELEPLLTNLALVIGELLVAIQPLIGEAIAVLIEIMPDLISVFQALVDLVQELAPLVAELAPLIGALLVGALETVLRLTTLFVIGLTETVAAVNGAIESVKNFADSALGQILVRALLSVIALLQGDWDNAWGVARMAVSRASVLAAQAVAGMSENIRGILGRLGDAVGSLAAGAMSRLTGAFTSGVASAVGAVQSLRSRALSVLSSLAGSFFDSGRALISSFVSGMLSQIGSVAGAASDIVSAARDFFPFSPAKKGPFSGQGYTYFSGQKLIRGFMGGIESQTTALQEAMSKAFGVPLLRSSPLISAPSAAGSSFAGIANTTFARLNPTVNVYLGNELVTDRVQAVVDESTEQRDRLASQGVRN